jgi:pimeloyl-ACP methyl ester carboxylesterase
MAPHLSPTDADALTGELAAYFHGTMTHALASGSDGWIDDDLAFLNPWGFDLGSIRVPVQLWQGGQDLMVPRSHGDWLARHVPSAEVHVSPDDGHLTVVENHLGEVHAWLAAQL